MAQRIDDTATDERSVSLTQPGGWPPRVVYTRVATDREYGGVSRVFLRGGIEARRRRSVQVRP